MRKLPSLIPALFLSVLIFICGWLWHILRPPTLLLKPVDAVISEQQKCLSAADAKTPPDLKTLRSCEERIDPQLPADDYVRLRVDELRWMLGLIGALAALFSIAQGAAAFFSAQTANKTVDDSLRTIKERLDDVTARYPLFPDVARKRDKAYDALRAAMSEPFGPENPNLDSIQALQYLEDIYAAMTVPQREQLLSVESFISLDLNQGAVAEEEYAPMLTRLALFYHSKFLYEESFKRGQISDLERAESYLKIVCERGGNDFKTLNELGFLYMTFAYLNKERYLSKAEETFTESFNRESKQQRVHFNRSVIKIRFEKDEDGEKRHLLEAKKLKRWQDTEVPYMTGFIYFNLGCNEGRRLGKANQPITMTIARDCLDYLEQAASRCRIRKIDVEKEFQTDGDLFAVYKNGDDSVKATLAGLRQALVDTPSGTGGLLKALQSAASAFVEARKTKL